MRYPLNCTERDSLGLELVEVVLLCQLTKKVRRDLQGSEIAEKLAELDLANAVPTVRRFHAVRQLFIELEDKGKDLLYNALSDYHSMAV